MYTPQKLTLSPITSLVVVLFLLGMISVPVKSGFAQSDVAQELGISSKRFIVIDADTGEVLAEQNADERVAIASLTKVFTTIEALERGDLDQLITTKQADVYDSSSTLMGFGPGETFTLKDLLYGMMLPSGNDAAHAIARALGEAPGATDQEAYENFIALMNERIRNMGLQNTNLMNPHGWGVEGHYSTARDVAAFVMYALQYPTFRDIIGTYSYSTSRGGYTVTNTNRLLNQGFSGLIGGKTGYDDESGYCLVEVAVRGDTTLISVTLDGIAPDVWYEDNMKLLSAGFTGKQQRISNGREIQGDLVQFRNPDAAVIESMAIPAASIGELLSSALAPDSAEVPSSAAPGPIEELEVAGSSTPFTEKHAEILGVVAVLALIAVFAAYKGFTLRHHAHEPDL